MAELDDIGITIESCALARVELRGEIDAEEARQLAGVLADLVVRVPEVEVDVAAVTFFGSAALTALVTALIDARSAGHDLRLVSLTDPIRRVLDMTGLADDLAPGGADG